MKKQAVAANESHMPGVNPVRDNSRKRLPAKPAGLNVRLQLLQNSRSVIVQGRRWWPWKAAI